MEKQYKEIYSELAKLVPSEIAKKLGKEELSNRFQKIDGIEGDKYYELPYYADKRESIALRFYPEGAKIAPMPEKIGKIENKLRYVRGDTRLVDADIKKGTSAVDQDTIIQHVMESK